MKPFLFALVCVCLVVAGSPAALAQDRPVVFLHGLMSHPSTWTVTAARIQAQLAIEPHLPDTNESRPYAEQALNAHNVLSYLDSSTVAIGHSNGGLVARQWSRLRPFGGIITVGTPHRGAPLSRNLPAFMDYGDSLATMLFNLIADFTWNCCSWQWVLANISAQIWDALGVFNMSVGELVGLMGLQVFHPVVPEMFPGSTFFQDINSGANIAREAGGVGVRVGIVSIPNRFAWGGPLRAAFPDQGDELAFARDVAGYFIEGYALHIFLTAAVDDDRAWRIANSLWTLAQGLALMDPMWCWAVSISPGINRCWENDTIVPTWSQDYSDMGAQRIVASNGPAHTQQTQDRDGYIVRALTQYVGVPERVTPPPPPGPPPPPPSSGSDTLWAETSLFRGDSRVSADGRFHLDYQWDGNLVLYDEWGTALWWSGTWGPPSSARMRADGGFMIYNGYGDVVWDSGTRGPLGNWFLRVENNGTIVIYTPDGTPVWTNY